MTSVTDSNRLPMLAAEIRCASVSGTSERDVAMIHPTLTPSSAGMVANGATRATSASTEPARQGHKVIWSVMALAEAGALKPWHRDFEVRDLAIGWLKSQGCPTARMPGDGTWKRELQNLRHLWRLST